MNLGELSTGVILSCRLCHSPITWEDCDRGHDQCFMTTCDCKYMNDYDCEVSA